ncbi:hypothetical protein GGR55DRAFT_680143 [Xylaria sp. FL0064]|nr:hypothetical protein GGR55DRAFT_680143 [Xylaria sp. FL0064]
MKTNNPDPSHNHYHHQNHNTNYSHGQSGNDRCCSNWNPNQIISGSGNINGITNSNDSLPKYILLALAKYSDDKDGDGDDGRKNRLPDLAPRGSSILGGVPDISTGNSSRSNGQRPPERDVGAVEQNLRMGPRRPRVFPLRHSSG